MNEEFKDCLFGFMVGFLFMAVLCSLCPAIVIVYGDKSTSKVVEYKDVVYRLVPLD